MAGNKEERYLEWLDREEERLGFGAIDTASEDIELARVLFYDELGYDMTEAQFDAIKSAVTTRYEDFPAVSVSFGRVEQSWGFQDIYRDMVSGRFVSHTDVYDLLSAYRGS